MFPLTRVPLFLVWLSNAVQLTVALPVDAPFGRKDELVLVDEAEQDYADLGANSTTTLVTLEGAVVTGGERAAVHHQRNLDNESMMDTSANAAAADDLIFLTVKLPVDLLQKDRDSYQGGIPEIDLLAVDDFSASCSFSCESHAAGAGAEELDEGDGAVPREIELQTDDLSPPFAPRPSIDMSDFVALIPADEVKAIVANYYRNDAEVQRAFAYLSGRDFLELKRRIIAIPEMAQFLAYLNASGLDVIGFCHTLTNLSNRPAESRADPQRSPNSASDEEIIENTFVDVAATTAAARTMQSAQLAAKDVSMEATTTVTEPAESLNGLHGLVDSILDVLPQDQILTTFFDKLETDEQFAKLVDNVGSPEFARILHRMENSAELRNLIFTLHNNGIYITRIVDSLKAYFFLGTF